MEKLKENFKLKTYVVVSYVGKVRLFSVWANFRYFLLHFCYPPHLHFALNSVPTFQSSLNFLLLLWLPHIGVLILMTCCYYFDSRSLSQLMQYSVNLSFLSLRLQAHSFSAFQLEILLLVFYTFAKLKLKN